MGQLDHEVAIKGWKAAFGRHSGATSEWSRKENQTGILGQPVDFPVQVLNMKSFVGRFFCSLDSKGRLMIPARFRKIMSAEEDETLILSKGKDGCLNLYPSGAWNDLIMKLERQPAGTDRVDIVRYYSDNSLILSIDKAGRVALPAEFLNIIGGPAKVAVMGALSYMEIWAPEDYSRIRQRAEETYQKGKWPY